MRKNFRSKILLIAIVLFTIGCTHVIQPPEAMVLRPVTVYLYDKTIDLQQTCEVEGWNVENCSNLRGIFRSNSQIRQLHCVKWDFESCGHELHHALQRNAYPSLNAEDREHFRSQ